MKTSLIIPVFNEEKFLPKCLRSVLHQTIFPDEIIIVDNASTDNSLKEIKKYTKKLPIKIYHEKRKGIRYAVTNAWGHSTGDLILRTDADCILPTNWVKRMISHFQQDPELAACGGLFRAADGPKIAHILTPIAPTVNLAPLSLANGCLVLYGGNMAIRAEVLRRLKPTRIIQSQVNDDVCLSRLLAKNNLKYRYFADCWCRTSTRRFTTLESSIKAFLADFDPRHYQEKAT